MKVHSNQHRDDGNRYEEHDESIGEAAARIEFSDKKKLPASRGAGSSKSSSRTAYQKRALSSTFSCFFCSRRWLTALRSRVFVGPLSFSAPVSAA